MVKFRRKRPNPQKLSPQQTFLSWGPMSVNVIGTLLLFIYSDRFILSSTSVVRGNVHQIRNAWWKSSIFVSAENLGGSVGEDFFKPQLLDSLPDRGVPAKLAHRNKNKIFKGQDASEAANTTYDIHLSRVLKKDVQLSAGTSSAVPINSQNQYKSSLRPLAQGRRGHKKRVNRKKTIKRGKVNRKKKAYKKNAGKRKKAKKKKIAFKKKATYKKKKAFKKKTTYKKVAKYGGKKNSKNKTGKKKKQSHNWWGTSGGHGGKSSKSNGNVDHCMCSDGSWGTYYYEQSNSIGWGGWGHRELTGKSGKSWGGWGECHCPKDITYFPTFFPTYFPTPFPTEITEVPTGLPTTLQPTIAPTVDPTASPTDSPTFSPTMNPTQAPTESPTESPTPLTLTPTTITEDPTYEPTTPSPTKKRTHSPNCQPTERPTDSPTLSPTGEPTLDPTQEPTMYPTTSPTLNPTDSPTVAPTGAPIMPTQSPTLEPTLSPTQDPTGAPIMPTQSPTVDPTESPTQAPTGAPIMPTQSPTVDPTESPTQAPTGAPIMPTQSPTFGPTESPTLDPTMSPTLSPTASPTGAPIMPTQSPTFGPTESPTTSPTDSPTESPLSVPTLSPTFGPTMSPTLSPTMSPTDSPTESPFGTTDPTSSPTLSPTMSPTLDPTASPTDSPTESPIGLPTLNPTTSPTLGPTMSPTLSPTFTPTFSPTEIVLNWWYWGAEDGRGDELNNLVNQQVPDFIPENVRDVSAGSRYTMVIDDVGRASSQGFIESALSYRGHFGVDPGDLSEGENSRQVIDRVVNTDGDEVDAPPFLNAYAGATPSADAGEMHSLLIDEFGNAYTMGNNDKGQLCLGDEEERYIPHQVDLPGPAVQGAVGGDFTLILLQDGNVYGCGSNEIGQLGLGNNVATSNTPDDSNGLKDIGEISAGLSFSLFKGVDNTKLYSSGSNVYGQQCFFTEGDPQKRPREFLLEDKNGDAWQVDAIEAGRESSYYLLRDGTVLACGRNDEGQLGDGTFLDTTPADPIVQVDIPKDERIYEIGSGPSAQNAFFVGLEDVYAAGANDRYQLGIDEIGSKEFPVKVDFGEDVDIDKVSASGTHTVAMGVVL